MLVVGDPLLPVAKGGAQAAVQPSAALGRGTQGLDLEKLAVEDEVPLLDLSEGEGEDTVDAELAVRDVSRGLPGVQSAPGLLPPPSR